MIVALPGGSLAGPAAPVDEPPPLGGSAPPPPASKIKPCGSYVTGKAAVVNRFTQANLTICGSQQADKITTTGGASYIETFGGVDFVNAKNGKPDEIWNGAGNDQGSFDSCDRVYGLESGRQATARCPGVASSAGLRTIQAVDYPAYLPTMDCRINAQGVRRINFSAEPLMRAVDATRQVDWQNVAWSALLYKWDGSRWVFRVQTIWLWDRTYDEQVRAFPGNNWRNFDKNQRRFVFFQNLEAGVYRVAIHYRWYSMPGVPAKDLKVWAGRHLGEYEQLPGRQACEFPAPTPPVSALAGTYRGTTSQGAPVTLDVGTTGTTVTKFTFGDVVSEPNCAQAGLGVFRANAMVLTSNDVKAITATIGADGRFVYNSQETLDWRSTIPGVSLINLTLSVTGRVGGGTADGTLTYQAIFQYQGVEARCRANVTWNARK